MSIKKTTTTAFLSFFLVSCLCLFVCFSVAAQDSSSIIRNDSGRTRVTPQYSEPPGGSLNPDEGTLPIMPDYTPPTPDVAALIKVGLGSLNKISGALTCSIPIYQIQTGKDIFPVTLQYYSQGNRPEEMCSSVGYGWALMAGGVITRDLQGLPDESSNRLYIPDTYTLTQHTTSLINYFIKASKHDLKTDAVGGDDTQPDVFSFSFCGYSGRFILDSAFNPVLVTYSNLKINIQKSANSIDGFKIITPDGTNYFFGDSAYERITSDQGSPYFINYPKGSYYLYKILYPTGQTITLNYMQRTITTNLGISEEWLIPAGGTNGFGGSCGCPEAGVSPLPPNGTPTITYHRRTYNARFISSIIASNGVAINFSYADTPSTDISNMPKLSTISITTSILEGLKKYNFRYLMGGQISNTYMPADRYYLSSIQESALGLNNDDTILPPLIYNLEYNSPQDQGNIFSQDAYGFANGRPNSTLLVNNGSVSGFTGADRSPNWNASIKGVLRKITYPTAETEEFICEANTIQTTIIQTTEKSSIDYYSSSSSSNCYGSIDNISATGMVYFNLNRLNMPLNEPASGNKVAFITITDENTNSIASNITLFRGVPVLYDSFPGVQGHSYLVSATIPNYTTDQIHFSLHYFIQTPVWGNAEAPGIRVARIFKTDPFTRDTVNQYFVYSTFSDSLRLSSGAIASIPVTYYYATYAHSCDGFWCAPSYCTNLIFTSTPRNNLFFDGSHIFYSHVIEADNPQFVNGATQWDFAPNPNNSAFTTFYGDKIYGLPDNQFVTLMDQPLSIKTYNSQSKLVTEKDFKYNVVRIGSIYPVLTCNKVFSLPCTSASGLDSIELALKQFDVTYYQYLPGYILDTLETDTQYNDAGNAITETITKKYGSVNNLLPQQIIATDSKGIQTFTSFKYPTDLTSSSSPNVYNYMVANNIIDPVIETSIVRNGVEQTHKTTSYQAWNVATGVKIYEPSQISLKATPNSNLEERVSFNAYDKNGNVLEVQPAGGLKEVYLWGYASQFPVAKIVDADYATASALINQNVLDAPTSDAALITELNKLRTNLPKSLVTTYTYNPFVGITTETNPSGKIMYYQYDIYDRLKTIKDKDNNILKKYDYHYQTKDGCTNFAPSWQPVEEPFCGKDQNNNNTGTLQQLQLDINVCSSSYLIKQINDVGVSTTTCPIVPNCTGEDKRVVNGACETGTKVYSRSVQIGQNTYQCYYHYEWSDGFHSQDYFENSTRPCLIL